MSRIADDIYNQVARMYAGRRIGASSLISVVLSAMQLAQQYRDLTGPEKKAIVTGIVQRLVSDAGVFNAADRDAASYFIAASLPALIDTLKDVAKTGGDLLSKSSGFLSCCRK